MTGAIPEQTAARDAADEKGMEGLARPGRVDGRAIFIGWEKLRIAYNVALALPVIFVMAWPGIADPRFFLIALLYAIAANMLYFAGPIVEAYVAWLARKTYIFELRLFLFITGTIASMVLAGLCVMSFSKFMFFD